MSIFRKKDMLMLKYTNSLSLIPVMVKYGQNRVELEQLCWDEYKKERAVLEKQDNSND